MARVRTGPRIALWLLVCAATAALLATAAPRAGPLVDTAGLTPPDHPYVQLNGEITSNFGMENPVVWVIEAREGTVWTTELLARLQALTREVFKIPGVIPQDVISVASPNLRDVEVTATGMRPVYLMGRVPETPEAIEALRRRVVEDPNYRGNLVSLDERAAMVVANFRSEADGEVVAAKAAELKERYADSQAAVYATGAPLLMRVPPGAIRTAIMAAIAIALAGFVVCVWLLGARAAIAIGVAGLLALLWTVSALVAAGLAALPWTVYALPATALVAGAIALSGGAANSGRLCVALVVALLAGFGVLAQATDAPARALGVAGMVGSVAAVIAGTLTRVARDEDGRPLAATRWAHIAALCLIVLSAIGLLRLHVSLGLAGYGQRYPLGGPAADLRAIAKRFPPPTALALRVRGEKQFVSSPAVLHAFDGVVKAAREDPAVVSAMSLADIVKMVNYAFNEKQEEFLTIPDDRGLIARYLALAYSPGFRRFVDRALASAALWIYVRGDDPADLARVLGIVEAQLAANPVPDAEVDLVGGDGAEILVMAATVRQLAGGAIVGLLVVAVFLAVLGGLSAGMRGLGGGAAAAVAAAGALGWLGVPIDLITLPLLIVTGMAGAALGALGTIAPDNLLRFGPALAVMALPALAIPQAVANVFGAIMLGAAVSSWIATRSGSPR